MLIACPLAIQDIAHNAGTHFKILTIYHRRVTKNAICLQLSHQSQFIEYDLRIWLVFTKPNDATKKWTAHFFSLTLSRIGTISSLAVDVSNSRLFPFFADVLNKIGSMQPVNWLKTAPKSMEPINWLRQSGRLRFASCAKLHSNIFSFRIKIKLSFRTKMCFFWHSTIFALQFLCLVHEFSIFS